MKPTIMILTTTALCAWAGLAAAQSQGDWKLGLGVASVSPNGGTSTTTAGPVDVDANIRPIVTAEYFIADNIGIELLASWPFEHDINLGGNKVASTKHLPPTLSLQYYFTNSSDWTPFIGAGVNYTHFFDESTSGALTGANISLDDSFGIALHAGVDYRISARGSLRADLRWIDIDTDVKVNGTDIGEVSIDPIVYGLSYVIDF
ncbi:MAG: OmpW family outer membrane protein [Pseudomonadota bacterium]